MSPKSLDQYGRALDELLKLFGKEFVERRKDRLQAIFAESEQYWSENLKRYGSNPVKYLLLAEAPPWRPEGEEVSYFYKNFERGTGSILCRAVWNCFNSQPLDFKNGLEKLAKNGFILIDTLPFPMRYPSRIRRQPGYRALLRASEPFLASKISAVNNWDGNVKVALAFKLNGEAVINELGNVSLPTGQKIRLNNWNIAAGRSNYTETSKLKRIFFGNYYNN